MRAPRTIGELMTPCPVSVRASQSLAEAHARMRDRRIRHLPVMEHGQVVGVVSQGDLRLLESIDRVDTHRVRVEEAMTHHPCLVAQDEPLPAVLDRMYEGKLGSILVMDRDRLVGIFTAVDAVDALRRLLRAAEETELAAASGGTHENA